VVNDFENTSLDIAKEEEKAEAANVARRRNKKGVIVVLTLCRCAGSLLLSLEPTNTDTLPVSLLS